MSDAALDGIRVVELAGPLGEWCGKLFADMGADVVKVEPPGGAASRAIGPYLDDAPHPERSLHFWHYNTSKRGVTLDIGRAESRDVLRRLIASADVFLETLPPGRAAELGIDYATLSAAHPRLVHVAITPFGQSGPYVEAGYRTTDLVTMALGGPLQSCGYDAADGELPPVRPGANHSHHTASHYACVATLVALYEREGSGRGQYIDVAAQAALAVTVEFANLYWEHEQAIVRRQTGRHAFPIPMARTQYLCADGRYINLGLPRDDRTWGRLLDYLAERGLGGDLDLDALRDPATRFERASAVYDVLETLTATHSAVELFHIGQGMGLTWAAVRAPEDWLDDAHARERGFFAPVEHPELGRSFAYPGAPYKFEGTPWRIRRRAPLIGEDNAAAFGELGLSASDIARLAAEGVV